MYKIYLFHLSVPRLGNTFLPRKRNLFDKFKGHRKQNAPLGLSPKVLRQNMTNSAKQNRKQELQTVPPKQNAYKHAPSIYLSMYVCVGGRTVKVYLLSRGPHRVSCAVHGVLECKSCETGKEQTF